MKKDEVAAFAARYDPDPPHARQVERLSLLLFDALAPLHRLGEAERDLLSSAALLHDIGWVGGVQGHHKRSCLMVLEDTTLPFGDEERTLVALVARYHRRALPARKHPLFAALSPEDQATVSALAAVLRVADGLDVGHAGAVADLACTLGEEAVTVALTPCGPVDAEVRAAEKKGDLFFEVYRRRLFFEVRG
jgi:exopolyphosphatase/guanosine-5'-triphosphate,3'-diphosphate pyrophosphatase